MRFAAVFIAVTGCAESSEELERAYVQKHCGTCHAMPRPTSFPTSEWPHVIEWMNGVLEIIAGGLLMPGYSRIKAQFDTRAPLSLFRRQVP